jgi:ferric hydroxamate transport system ATP-binding protein
MRLEGIVVEASGCVLLSSLTLALADRGVTGLIGQNGSGKSTLLKLMARQQPPTRGTIRLDDRPIEAFPERAFAQRVGYLPQDLPPAAGLTVSELVALGRYPWHGALGRFGETDREKVAEAMSLTATDSLARRYVDTLSGGERQRAWLAMLLAQDARLLLLDEPISALDAAHQIGVLKLVRRISDERHVAVVMVLHDVNLAARFSDRLVALKGGRLVAEGPPREFMTPARLEEIYNVVMNTFPHPETGEVFAYLP